VRSVELDSKLTTLIYEAYLLYDIWVNSRTFCIFAKYEYKSKLHYSDASAQLSGLLQEIAI